MADAVPPWLAIARSLIGTDEYAGAADNPTIVGWSREIAQRWPEFGSYPLLYAHDATAWCGQFAAICCTRAGIRPPFGPRDTDRYLWAQSWKQVRGERLDAPRLGAILVFARHVTFYDGDAGGGFWWCVGGNQSDSVTRARYRAADCEAMIWPKIERAAAPMTRYTGITATVFGGQADLNHSAYDNHLIDDDEFGCALPYRFTGERPQVRIHHAGRSVLCDIVDVGPWNTNDPYWLTGARPQAESGTDTRGRRTNGAGIDLTPAAARAIGLPGKGVVDWEFVGATADQPADRPIEPDDITAPADNPELEACLRDIATAIRPILERHMAPVPAPQPDIVEILGRLADAVGDRRGPFARPSGSAIERLDAATAGYKTIAGVGGMLLSWLGGKHGFIGPELGDLAMALFGLVTAVGIGGKIDRLIAAGRAAGRLLAKLQAAPGDVS